MKRLATGLVLALVAFAGCGDDEDDEPARTQATTVTETQTAPPDTEPQATVPGGGDAQQIQATWRRYTTALADEDGATVCSLLTENGKEEVLMAGAAGDTCEEKVEEVGRFFKGFETELTDIKVQGDTAEAVSPARGQIQKQGLGFERVGGEWKIDRSTDIE